MNIFTHLGISMRLKRFIEKNMNIKLNTLSFLWGNIKPDITSRRSKVPHFKKDADVFFKGEIKKIMNMKVYPNGVCSNEISERLGILTHYLSDFFCHAHSKNFTGGILKHQLYEMHISLYFALHSHTSVSKCNGHGIVHWNATSMCNYIDLLHSKYLSSKKYHPSVDIAYVYQACITLCHSIFVTCIEREPVKLPVYSLSHF